MPVETFRFDLLAFAWMSPEAYKKAAGSEYEEFRKLNPNSTDGPHDFVYWQKAKGSFATLKANGYQRPKTP